MCGRTRCTLAPDQVLRLAGGASRWEGREQYTPSYNASPGFAAPVVRQEDGKPVVHTMRWGLVPSFTKPEEKPDFWRMFNARSESVAEKASFSRLVPRRRCLVVAEGFYEWKKEKGGERQPYYIHLADGEPLVMAGLWDVWASADGPVHTYTILTTDASPRLEWLHDRMPVVLRSEEAQRAWLDTDDKERLGTLHKLYSPYNGEDLTWYPVTKQMNKVSFQGAECCKELKKPSVASFFQPRSAKIAAAAKEEAAEEHGKGAGATAGEGAPTAAAVKQEAEQAPVEQPGAAGPPGAAVNADEQPDRKQAAAGESAAGEQAAGSAGPAGQHGSPHKRKQSAAASSPAKHDGRGGSAKKAKLPGQLDIKSFFRK